MAFKGMNPEEGREVATAVIEAGQRILESIDTVTNVVNSVEWVGPDYDAYQQDWNAFVSGPVAQLAEAFQMQGDRLNQDAEEQDQTSNSQ